MFDCFIRLVRDIYQTDEFIPLHAPRFQGKEKQYLLDVIDSSFVSSVGPFVTQFEEQVAGFCGVKHAIATVNGTAALHIALILAGVQPGEEVITQAVSFVATSNAVRYCGAEPVFIDVDLKTLGLSADSLAEFLNEYAELRDDGVWNKHSGKRIAACLPMHTFGHPCDIESVLALCNQYRLPVVEDAAEALGSQFKGRHCGAFGKVGVLSFNGNKIMTTGGGGMLLTNDTELAAKAKHLTTTAKMDHPWRFMHDQVAYNYRLPNLNAALGLAQLDQMPLFIRQKRALAARYIAWAKEQDVAIVVEPDGAQANYWLNALLVSDVGERERFLDYAKVANVMLRPLWELTSNLPMYSHCQTGDLRNSQYLAERLVNIPSSVV